MIVNISGRTDIVAFYSKWLQNRFKEGYVDVRNPYYEHQVSRIFFDDVDCIVFCTKNPIPLLDYIETIDKPIQLQVTLTGYREDIEPNVHSKSQIIEAIQKLSTILGKENVYVRYDPILLNPNYSLDYHIKAITRLLERLDGYISKLIFSFVDIYKNVKNNAKELQLIPFQESDYEKLGKALYQLSIQHQIDIHTCFEERNLVEYGLKKDCCTSIKRMFEMTGKLYETWKARDCGCVSMVDIGYYNCCSHLCKYCYANYDEKRVYDNMKKHDENSSLLIGHLTNEDIITIRKK